MAKGKGRSRGQRRRNEHAEISVRENRNAQFGGFSQTLRRDDDFYADIHTDSSNRTELYLRGEDATVYLSGHQARTLQRLLNKHFSELGRSTAVLGAE